MLILSYGISIESPFATDLNMFGIMKVSRTFTQITIKKSFSSSNNKPSPRKELLHNIDPLTEKIGQRKYIHSFDNRIHAAIRVGDMKLLTGDVGKAHGLRAKQASYPVLVVEFVFARK